MSSSERNRVSHEQSQQQPHLPDQQLHQPHQKPHQQPFHPHNLSQQHHQHQQEQQHWQSHQQGSSYLSFLFHQMSKYFIPTSSSLLHSSQRNLLERFVKVNISHQIFSLKSGEYLNFIEIQKQSCQQQQQQLQQQGHEHAVRSEKPTLILMHGFGSGLGMFFENYDYFSQRFDRVIAVDWLGMGGSSRPTCSGAPRLSLFNGWCTTTESMDPTKAANFFIDSLEEFRQEKQINNFVLAGHSLGGYLSARYAMKYPHQGMKALILISPAGLADHPPLEHQIPTSELSTPIRLLDVMWSSNFTPQQVVRFLGPKGPAAVKNMVSRRFGSDRWKESDSTLIADYLYHISAAPASGEYAMNSILRPIVSKKFKNSESEKGDYHSTSVYAREPISPKLFSQAITQSSPLRSVSSSPLPRCPPVLLLYGDHDWLRFPKMDQYIRDLRSHDVNADLITVPSAGHHLYLDNAVVFHEKINEWLDSVNVK